MKRRIMIATAALLVGAAGLAVGWWLIQESHPPCPSGKTWIEVTTVDENGVTVPVMGCA